MRRLVILAAFLSVSACLARAVQLQGVIADWSCVKPMVKQGREEVLLHNRRCSMVQNYRRSAYGLITSDKKFYRLDDPGNQRIMQILKESSDRDNLHVVVQGDLQGNTIKVVNISLL